METTYEVRIRWYNSPSLYPYDFGVDRHAAEKFYKDNVESISEPMTNRSINWPLTVELVCVERKVMCRKNREVKAKGE